MKSQKYFRYFLRFGAIFNFGAALILLFPESIGAFAQLPPMGPIFYMGLLALFVALFAATYAWLSFQRVISRELIGLAAIGKTGVFIVSVICWLGGNLSTPGLVPAVADLAFGVVFFWWLFRANTAS